VDNKVAKVKCVNVMQIIADLPCVFSLTHRFHQNFPFTGESNRRTVCTTPFFISVFLGKTLEVF
jgi:hypothetical protein